MKKSDIFLYVLLAVAVAILAYSISGLFGGSTPADAQPVSVPTGSTGLISTGSTNAGDVQIDISVEGISEGKLRLNIAANTHSVDLSQFDLKQITTLEYGGNSAKPVEAPVLSGHHSSGTLVFEAPGGLDSAVVRIKGIPKVEERLFNIKLDS